MVGLISTSKRVYAKGDLPRLLLPAPHPRGERLQTQSSIGDPPLAGSFSSVSRGVTSAFPWVLVHARSCLCPPGLELLFPPVLWKFYNQIPLAFKIRFPGVSQPCCQNPRLEAWCGVQNFTTMGELLWYYCFPVCGSPTWQVWDLFLS